MRVVIQRVQEASVTIKEEETARIGQGLLIFAGFEANESVGDLEWMAAKIANLRIFDDASETMNLSVKEVKGELLVVSQFTLHASTKKGNRPSYIKAAHASVAIPFYGEFIGMLAVESGIDIQTGDFGEEMQVSLINDGPVTIFIDSKNRE